MNLFLIAGEFVALQTLMTSKNGQQKAVSKNYSFYLVTIRHEYLNPFGVTAEEIGRPFY